MKNFITQSKGFTLLESIILVVLGSIIFVAVSQVYIQYLKESNRQQRFVQVERELFAVKDSLGEALISLPGRGLATTNGLASGTPILPAAGSIQDPTGKRNAIKLGIITPYKINGKDAFTVAYADSKVPRLAISEPTTASGNTGKAKVSLIATQSNFRVKAGTPTSSIAPPTNARSNFNTSNNLTISDASNTLALQVKGGSSPSPSPSPSSSPSPNPSPTNTSNPESTPLPSPIPPNVPLETTLLDLPWKPNPNMFNPGDVLLLINTPEDFGEAKEVQTSSRLVKIINMVGTNNSKGELQSIDITFDLCLNNECSGLFPGLSNPPDAPTQFSAGAILVPLKLTTFFYKSDKMSNRLVRNRGGVVLPTEDGKFQIQGGEETILGEVDNFIVTYHLRDGSKQPTPNSPIVNWLGEIVSVDTEIAREIPSAYKEKAFSRQAKLNFPIAIRNLN